MSEWDNTPWAGVDPKHALVPVRTPIIRVPDEPPAVKAATGLGVIKLTYEPKLESSRSTPQELMKKFLKAYKVTWFYKAESVISADVSNLEPELTRANGTAIPFPDRDIPFEQLNPIDKCARLLQMPNEQTTWRKFIEKTQIQYDMAGNHFWYLDQIDELFQTPTALYNVSPTRMWPSAKNGKIIGWVLDYDGRGGGTPFTAEEIVHLAAGNAEDDVWGVGVVEAVLAEAMLSGKLTTHIDDVLTLGGRLAGMISPKDRSLDENEFQDIIRAWRNIANSGDAGRRLLVFPEPVEWTRGSATPVEIGLQGLTEIHRTNILSAFPISEFRLGVPQAAGLNSGDTRKHMFREYWEFTIHSRVRVLKEIFQRHVVDRFSEMAGEELVFNIKEPDRDDAPSLLEKAAAFRALLNLGFDPTSIIANVGLNTIKWDPSLLEQMLMDAFLGATEAAGQAGAATQAPGLGADQHANGLAGVRMPNPLRAGDVGQRINVNDSSRKDNVTVSQQLTTQRKASKTLRGNGLDDVGKQVMAKRIQKRTKEFLGTQRDRIISKVQATWPAQKAARKAFDDTEWWDEAGEDEELLEALSGFVEAITVASLEGIATEMNVILTPDKVDDALNQAFELMGDDINAINQTTKNAIRQLLSEGARRGYSINQIVGGVPDENFPGLQNLLLENSLDVWGDWRAETIARTELLGAYNRSNLLGWASVGLTHVEAKDGDVDAECRARNGQRYSILEALRQRDHPNGTLDWIPLERDGYVYGG